MQCKCKKPKKKPVISSFSVPKLLEEECENRMELILSSVPWISNLIF